MPQFQRYIGIDYSGAKTPISSLDGVRVYVTEGDSVPEEELPPSSRLKYWTRLGLAEWLQARLAESQTTIVGIDHAFSFPFWDSHHA